MGYTHYWNFRKKTADINNFADKFKQAAIAVKECIAKVPPVLKTDDNDNEVPFKLCGCNGYGEPVFSDECVGFNGDAEKGYDHESFIIGDDECNKLSCGYCKTAREPYDVAVCIALICFKKVFGDDFTYSSDGDIKNGEEGWGLAKEITGEYFA